MQWKIFLPKRPNRLGGCYKLILSTGSAEELRQKEHELEVLKLEATRVYFEKFLAIREVLTPVQVLKQCEIFALTNEERIEKFLRKKPDRN